MKLFLRRVHRYIYRGSVLFFFILLYPFLYYFSRRKERFAAFNRFRYLLGFLSSSFAGIFFRYRMKQEIDWTRNYIICPNHSSDLDIAAISLFIRSNFAFIGKEELLGNPVTRLFFTTIDIPLNRDSKISAFRAFKKAEDYLRNGMSLVIFPEGMIPDDYPPVLSPFKNGPFRLAIDNQVPIIPVSIRNNWHKMWDDGAKYGSRPGICDICVHEPVEVSGLKAGNVDALRDKIFDIINSGLR